MEENGKTVVCMLTGRQMAAIGSVALAGAGAEAMLRQVFRGEQGSGVQAGRFETGRILHGRLVSGQRTIDEVVVGCEGKDLFVLHCHGNPLILEQAVRLFEGMGAVLTEAQTFELEHNGAGCETLIEAEARLWMQKAATLSGVKIISSQVTEGLLPTVRRWLDEFDALTLEELWAQCHQVLRKSSRAKYLIQRCKIVIIGPPNSGKSTLLNQLAGRSAVIVSDTAGTTRDWVSITCRLGPLLAEVYDTAGLDAALMQEHAIDKMAQQATLELLDAADMNIFIYDAMDVPRAQELIFALGSFKAVVAVNKVDLLSPRQREIIYSKYVPLCAKTGDGIELLIKKLTASLKVEDYDCTAAVCFTERQLEILRQLLHTKEKPQAKELIERLLFGTC